MEEERKLKKFFSHSFLLLLTFFIATQLAYPAKAWTDMSQEEKLEFLHSKVEGNNIHYVSTKSEEKKAESNFLNDGAKEKDSIVIGINSTSSGKNSAVYGNNIKLTGDKNGRNNSIVVGHNIEVDGTHNAVFATDYRNYDNKTTHVFGEQNTVIGVGNLVGWEAKKDPKDPTKWIYEKRKNGSDQNVVVGLTNIAKSSSVVIGTSSESDSLGTSVGHANKIIGMNDGGGQRGIALGNNLVVKGEEAIAIGTEGQANADWTIALGKESKSEKSNDIAIGKESTASGGWSIALGASSVAKEQTAIALGYGSKSNVTHGIALGSFSIADRERFSSEKLAPYSNFDLNRKTLGAVSVGGNGYLRQIINLADATEDTDAVNLRQLKEAVKNSNSETIASSLNFEGDKNSKGSINLSTEAFILSGTEEQITTKAEGNKLSIALDGKVIDKLDSIGTGKVIKGDTNTVTGDTVYNAIENKLSNNTIVNTLEKGNINSKTLEVTGGKEKVLGKDVSIELKEKSVTKSHLSEEIAETLNKVGNGVIAKEGEEAENTVTGKTVYEYLEKNNEIVKEEIIKNTNEIQKTKSEVRHVGALSAALAALHPMQYDPLEKNQIMAGIGTYQDKQAIAVGLTHYFNENLMMTAGVSLGEAERVKTMANVGITWKIGKEKSIKDSSEKYKKEEISSIYKMQEEIKAVLTENKILKEKIEKLEKQIEILINNK